VKKLTQIGATVEEAISLALQKLDTTLENVEVEVLDEGKKGFLGFGARPAEVRVTLKEVEVAQEEVLHSTKQEDLATDEQSVASISNEIPGEEQVLTNEVQPEQHDANPINPIEETKAYIESIAVAMGINDLRFDESKEGKYVYLTLHSKDAARLIGKRGNTLNSLQQLAQLVLNKSSQTFLMLKLDVENYRERRQESLELLAERMADKSIRTASTVKFEPMPSYERKIIHNALSNRLDIETYSEGEEPNRYLVIEPIK
jgi:spoIIIJ-associated protein